MYFHNPGEARRVWECTVRRANAGGEGEQKDDSKDAFNSRVWNRHGGQRTFGGCSPVRPATGGGRAADRAAGAGLCLDTGVLPVGEREVCLAAGSVGSAAEAARAVGSGALGTPARGLVFRGRALAVMRGWRGESPGWRAEARYRPEAAASPFRGLFRNARNFSGCLVEPAKLARIFSFASRIA